jgi:hypothetical protein
MWVTPKAWFSTASSGNHNSVATIFGLQLQNPDVLIF